MKAMEPGLAAVVGQSERGGSEPRPRAANAVAEWIDPEGEDWFASIYWELADTAEQRTIADESTPEPAFWFG
jgi:hypothetical protein